MCMVQGIHYVGFSTSIASDRGLTINNRCIVTKKGLIKYVRMYLNLATDVNYVAMYIYL